MFWPGAFLLVGSFCSPGKGSPCMLLLGDPKASPGSAHPYSTGGNLSSTPMSPGAAHSQVSQPGC